jgi:hypothetical protein
LNYPSLRHARRADGPIHENFYQEETEELPEIEICAYPNEIKTVLLRSPLLMIAWLP